MYLGTRKVCLWFTTFFFSFILRYFEGYTPVLSVSDPDLLKDVLVKDFENFQSRKVLKNELKKRMIESEKNVINRIVSNCIFSLSVLSPSLWLQEKASGCFWKMVINGNVVEPCWPPPLVLENSNKCLESWTSAQTTCWRAWTKRQRAARHWTFMSKH